MNFLNEAQAYEGEMRAFFEDLHRHPEPSHFENRTNQRVREQLRAHQIDMLCPKDNITIAVIRGAKPGKTVGLRFDTDALQMQELCDVPYKSETDGLMLGCGHDAHTTCGVYVARLLKAHADELCGTYKIIFQPAEEGEHGADEVIATGLVSDVDAFFGLHVWSLYPTGTLHATPGGIWAEPDMFKVTIHGKGGHGSMPNACIDPITAAAHIHIALQEINSRELDPAGFGVFTTGRFEAGKASNVIPDTADMWGTIRTVDPEQKVSALIHQRMTEIAQGVATAYRCTAEVEFSDYCPCMVVDTPLASNALTYMTELLGKGAMDMTPLTGGKPGGGSEDFAFVSHEVPTVSMFLAAGNAKEGYTYGQHHPKVRFDDSILYCGTAAYTYMALRWLAEHQ